MKLLPESVFSGRQADAPKEFIGPKPLQVSGKFLRADPQVAHEADNDWFVRREIEHPLVVLQSRAGLHDDRARHGPGHRQGVVILGQHRAIEQLVVAGRSRHALGASRVIEMRVGVDYGDAARARRRLTGRGPKG